jgi:hypothetical protein
VTRTGNNLRWAVNTVRDVREAQERYRNTHPQLGYACSLGELHDANLISDLLSHGLKAGYSYSVNCSPDRTHYSVVADPAVGGQTGLFTVCAEDGGNIRRIEYTQNRACSRDGRPFF